MLNYIVTDECDDNFENVCMSKTVVNNTVNETSTRENKAETSYKFEL